MSTTRDELRDELVAIMSARQELSADHEQYLAETFLERLDKEIDQRIQERLPAKKQGPNATEILAVSLVFAIPLSAIGAYAGQLTGLIVVWVAIALVVLFVSQN